MSFQAPYYCEFCHEEKYHLLQRGKDYEYPLDGGASRISIPEVLPCTRCSRSMMPDFVFDKTFLFLNGID
jgi:hypothetical protein